MSKSIAIGLLAAIAALSATQLVAAIISPSLPAGSQYQLIFVTSGGRDAKSTDIDDYNTFVTGEAALSPGLPLGATWRAVGSTADIEAKVNAPWISGLPVYNTHGDLVATSTNGLYFGSLSAPVGYDQFGDLPHILRVWTGSTEFGDGFATRELGTGGPIIGRPTNTDSRWLNLTGDNPNAKYPLYGLSDAITVVPEPATIVPMALAVLALAGLRCLRRCRRVPLLC
jgi:hypothetical protein